MNLRIGDWLLNAASGELTCDRHAHQLTPKSTALLRALAARPGELLTKQELLDSVWSGTVVSDAALTSCIRELRLAFADDIKQPRYIETLHRRGYRLIAAVRRESTIARAPVGDSKATIAGRERELAILRAALACAQDGERQIVFVTGDPGIGKSALVDAFVNSAAAASARVARGQCIEHHGPAEAYLPAIEALERLCRDAGDERTKHILAKHAPGWLAQMPGLLSTAELRAVMQRMIGATPQRLLRELTDGVEVLSGQGLLILVFEDLHWSDNATLDWLAFLARRKEPARLLIIGTYRRVEALARGHPLINVHAELRSHGLALQLQIEPLERTAVEELIAARFGSDATIRALAQRIHARTEGHPLFVLNMIEQLLARDALQLRDGVWRFDAAEPIEALVPGDVRRMIEHRVQRMSAGQQQLLQFASAVGIEFSAAAVAAAAGQSLHEIEAALHSLTRHDTFIRAAGEEAWPDGAYTGRFAFHHALYREVLYERLAPHARATAHVHIGDRLERGYGARADEIATEIAVHFEQGRLPDRAVCWRQRAAQNAIRRGATHEAIAHLKRARDALQNLTVTPERMRTEIEICIALGSQLMATGGWGAPEVEKTYSHAQRLCEQLEDRRELFPALWGLWLYRSGHGDMYTAHELSGTLLDLAANGTDGTLALQAHHAAWATALARGDLLACGEHACRGDALYVAHAHHGLSERYGNHDAGVCSRCFHSLALALRGEDERARAMGRAAIELAEELDHPFSTAFARYFSGALHQMLGDTEAAAEFATAAIRLARDQSFGLIQAWAACICGWAEARRSKSQSALAMIAENANTARASGTDLFQPYLLGLLAEACLETGDMEAGLDAVGRAQVAAQRSGEFFYLSRLHCLEAQLILRSSGSRDSARAQASIQKAIALARAQGAAMLERQALALLAQRY